MKFLLKPIYHTIINSFSPAMRMKISYFRIFKEWPNLKYPKTFNEKILNRILFVRDPKFAFYADKYAVRQYISEVLGENYLIPLIAVYDSAIDLNKLDQWDNIVIKPTHGAGMVKIIDKPPSISMKEEIIIQADNWLSTNYSLFADEWHYSLIPPKLVVEKKITSKEERLRDYKFHRFMKSDGSFKQILQIISERSDHDFETVFFDVSNLENILHSPFGYEMVLTEDEKLKIQKVLKLNEKLCLEYKYVRLDWYLTENNIYFGEITLTPGAGRSLSFQGKFGENMAKLWL